MELGYNKFDKTIFEGADLTSVLGDSFSHESILIIDALLLNAKNLGSAYFTSPFYGEDIFYFLHFKGVAVAFSISHSSYNNASNMKIQGYIAENKNIHMLWSNIERIILESMTGTNNNYSSVSSYENRKYQTLFSDTSSSLRPFSFICSDHKKMRFPIKGVKTYVLSYNPISVEAMKKPKPKLKPAVTVRAEEVKQFMQRDSCVLKPPSRPLVPFMSRGNKWEVMFGSEHTEDKNYLKLPFNEKILLKDLQENIDEMVSKKL